jgi:small subunit ribosomal protein S2
VIADAVAEGLIARSGVATGDEKADKGAAEPLAEWERDLLEGEKKADEPEAKPAEAAEVTEKPAEAVAEKPAEDEKPAEAAPAADAEQA